MYTTDSLLLEILVEELPPKNLKKLGLSFASKIYTQLQKQGLLGQGATLTPFITPRRLALHITQVLPQSPEKTTKQKLLPASVGFDTYGQPTTPLLKKLKKLGLEGIALDKIQQCQDGKVSDMLFVIDTVPGTSIAFALQYLLDKTIPDLPIPKPMRYQVVDNTSHLRTVSFARPARGLLALYGSQILSVHTLGLRACDYTWGHRSMAIKNPIFISHADQYENMLEHDGSVIPHYDRRQQKISEQLSQQVAKSGNHLQVLHNDALLDEVTALVEYPHTYLCQFDKTFLKLPQECLVLTMQTHQRYFPLVDEKSKVTHQFLVVSNIAPKDPRHVIKGMSV
jgi:glycyl-tRNA synthetase beta chain